MSLILKSDSSAVTATGRNIFNINAPLDKLLFVADFGIDSYAMRENGNLNKKSFSDVINYSRTGYTEYFSKAKGWQTATPNMPAIHFDKQSSLKGLLCEGAVAAAEQIINRQGADVLSSETVTTQYRNAFVWLLVQGTGSVTVSGDIENQVVGDGLIATENKPLYLRFVDNAGSSNLTFTTQGDVTTFSMVRIEMPGGRVPYFDKAVYQSRGITNVTLTDSVKNIVNTKDTYTLLIDISSPYGAESVSGFDIGNPTGDRLQVRAITGLAVSTYTSNGRYEAILARGRTVGAKNSVVAVTVLRQENRVIATNGAHYAKSMLDFNIGDFNLTFAGKNLLINRIAVLDGEFSQTQMLSMVNDWQVFS